MMNKDRIGHVAFARIVKHLFENWDFPFVNHQKKRSVTFCDEQRSNRTCGIRPGRETSLLYRTKSPSVLQDHSVDIVPYEKPVHTTKP